MNIFPCLFVTFLPSLRVSYSVLFSYNKGVRALHKREKIFFKEKISINEVFEELVRKLVVPELSLGWR